VSGPHRLLADGALLLVALVWGSTFVVVKEAVAQVPPMVFLALRFSLAAGALGLVFWRDVAAHWRTLALPGLVVGLFLWGGFTTQTLGLQYTEASRAGFITGLSVAFVPLLSAAVFRERPSTRALAGVALAVTGLALLFLFPGSVETAAAGAGPAAGAMAGAEAHGAAAAAAVATSGATLDKRRLGDLLILACAVFFAGHIVSLGQASRTRAHTARQAGALAAIQVGAAAVGYALASVPDVTAMSRAAAAGGPALPPIPWPVVGAVIVTGLLATAGAFLVQSSAQRHTTATHTALIFATEPVFAALFGWALLGEQLTGWPLFGCLLILVGMVLAELPARPARPAEPESEPPLRPRSD